MSDLSIHTEGGAVVGGDVTAGTFIGHDQIIVISDYTGEQLEQVLTRLQEILGTGRAALCADIARERLTVTAPDAPPIVLSAAAAGSLLPLAWRRADERAYLTALLVNPRYGRWASQFVPLAGTLATPQRPPGWGDVPPEFTLLEMRGEGPGRQMRRIRLEDITQATAQHEALVILGEPGAGKTTTLYKLALEAAGQRLSADGGEARVPLLVPLADYRDYPVPHAFVEAVWQQRLGSDGLDRALRAGRLLLLCDALNEMPFGDARDYRERIAAWRRFVEAWPGNQVLFTCRSRDYGEPLGLPQVEIERLDDGRVQAFLGKYLDAALAAQTWQHLRGEPLLDLVRNPYLLSLLAYVVAGGGGWPSNRGALFDGFVKGLLARERLRHHPQWLGEGALAQALTELAYRMQPLGEGTRLPRGQMLEMIPTQVADRDGPVETPGTTVVNLGLAATLLDRELAPEGQERLRFYHHQLQEYFAARALLERFAAGEDMSRHWRQPRLAGEMPDPGPLGDFEPLPPPPSTGWEEPTVLAAGLATDPAAFLEAMRRSNPVLAARCLTEAGAETGLIPAQLAEIVQSDLLQDMGDRRVHLRARIAAGETLGRLGDPRYERIEVHGQTVILPPLVYVPGGPLRMGSSRWQVQRLTWRGFTLASDEQPRHEIELPAFLIGRYPVTNKEFGCFVDAGGYDNETYWPSEEGRAWRRGEAESGAMRELMDVWQAVKSDPALLGRLRRAGWTPQQVAAWETLASMSEEEARAALGQAYGERPLDRPAFWDDARFNNPAQPVVGVTWHEALAYCCWLTEKMQEAGGTGQELLVWRDGKPGTLNLRTETLAVRLPSEAEWERAARGRRGWIYPWGNRWDAARANTWEGHVLRTTPVGIYPDGGTPLGTHDLSGNVWEWTRSLYRPYPYWADDGREELEAEGYRVVRGGSWFHYQRFARCASRHGFIPDSFDYALGFRLVVSLARSGF